MYQYALMLHVLTAIIGFGQTFLFPMILHLPKTNDQIQLTGKLIGKLSVIAKYSDWILLSTGILMIIEGKMHFEYGWVNLSIFVFVLMRLSSQFLSKKTASALHSVMNGKEHEQMVEEYIKKRNEFMPKLYLTQTLNFIIILLMIGKPAIPFLSF